jgi:2'-5' RNA ligase
MNSVISPMPGYRLNDYMLVLSPHEDLRNRISGLRNEFNEKYKPPTPLTGKPHMSLVHFVTRSMVEETLVQRFQKIALGVAPFKIELKDYGSFPTHTIYIQVATKVGFQSLVKELRSTQKLMKADPDRDPLFITEPFIAIGRKLLPWQYEQGWKEFSNRHFSARMIADGMLLLKRPVGERHYQVVQRFEFLNMPVATTQGELLFH